MTLRERIKELCNKKNISMNQLEKELGFGKGYVSKLDKSKPNASKIQLIADYFQVSIDYLIYGTVEKENTPEYDPEFLEMMSLYSKLKRAKGSVAAHFPAPFRLYHLPLVHLYYIVVKE